MGKIGLVMILALVSTSCTVSQRIRYLGGSETMKLEPIGQFINITWEQDGLCIIIKNKNIGRIHVREKYSYGIIQDKIIITK